jgi:hypothetical protein
MFIYSSLRVSRVRPMHPQKQTKQSWSYARWEPKLCEASRQIIEGILHSCTIFTRCQNIYVKQKIGTFFIK